MKFLLFVKKLTLFHKTLSIVNKFANIARFAMWVMIGAIILSFFISATWIRIVWVIAAAICLVSVLLVAYSKNKGRKRY